MKRILKNWLIGIALVVFSVTTVEQPYRKIIHNSDPRAKCLDGSSPAIYLHEGGDTTKFIIFFTGGGFCASSSLEETL